MVTSAAWPDVHCCSTMLLDCSLPDSGCWSRNHEVDWGSNSSSTDARLDARYSLRAEAAGEAELTHS
jgi:hypothetical protein